MRLVSSLFLAAALLLPCGQQGDASRVATFASADSARVTARDDDTSRTPRLPQLLDTRAPAITGRTIAVAAGGNLQAALDAARPGDVITLANEGTYTGNFVLRAKAGSTPGGGGWITIRPANVVGLPAEGTRLRPNVVGLPRLPKLVTPNPNAVLATAPGAAGWRLTGLELTVAPGLDQNYGLVVFGTGVETAMAQYPGRLVLDRAYIHGSATTQLKRCVALNSIATAIIDSYLDDCHAGSYYNETQGILGWNGPGPFKIANDYIAASGVSIMFGGADDPRIPGVMPSDIEIRGNHVVKPLAWRGKWSNKNSLELKDAQRVLIEANVFENNWAESQSGWMIQFTAVSQSNTAAWITVRDVTFRYNVLRNSPQGLALSARYAQPGGLLISEPTRRVLIAHNSFEQITAGNLLQLGGDHDAVTIEHNTGSATNEFLSLVPGHGPATRFVLRDNLFGHGLYGLGGDNTGVGAAALKKYAPGAVTSGNVVYGNTQFASQYPPGFTFLPTLAGVPRGAGADLTSVHVLTSGVVTP